MPYSLITNYSEMGNKTGNKFLNHCNEVSIQSKKVSFSGIPLDVSNGRATISEPEHHCLICGTSGRGKTRRVLYPMAVLSARSRHSLIVIDPKGELYRHCSNEIRRCGHDVRILNLRNPSQGDRWSSLSLIQKYWDEGKTGRAMVLLKSVATIILYWALCQYGCTDIDERAERLPFGIAAQPCNDAPTPWSRPAYDRCRFRGYGKRARENERRVVYVHCGLHRKVNRTDIRGLRQGQIT